MAKRVRKFGGGRTRLLEELGRVEAEPSNRNRRAEISRVHGELNRGYAKGGKVGTHKSVRHPHSKLRTQKESKAITDSAAYKKADYKSKTEMLGGKAYAKGGSTKQIGRPKTPRDKWKDRIKNISKRPSITDILSGGREGKPHSSKEGRKAAAGRAFRKIVEKQKPKRAQPRPMPTPGPQAPKNPRSPYIKDREMTPLRAKKAVGGIAKIIGKKAVDWIKKNRKTIRKEIYSPEGKKKTKDMLDNLKKKYGDLTLGPKKAGGGRISRGQGGSAAQQHYLQHGYGPTKTKLRSGKPKIAKKGWA